MKVRLGLAAAMLMVAAFAAGPAFAQYDGGDQALTVSDTTPAPGQTLHVEGCCFQSSSNVDIVIRSTPQLLAQVDADPSGQVAADVTIPSDIEPGEHRLTVSGVGADGAPMTLAIQLTVLGRASDSAGLAQTGIAIGSMVGAGVVLIGGGLLLARVRRRAA
jgi:LPXTG-motif cell wall-anchored protein